MASAYMTEASGWLNCRPQSLSPESDCGRIYTRTIFEGSAALWQFKLSGRLVMIIWLYRAMLRIARLLSHYSFGGKNSLERQKTLLIKRVNGGLLAPCRFPPRFDIKFSTVVRLPRKISQMGYHVSRNIFTYSNHKMEAVKQDHLPNKILRN